MAIYKAVELGSKAMVEFQPGPPISKWINRSLTQSTSTGPGTTPPATRLFTREGGKVRPLIYTSCGLLLSRDQLVLQCVWQR